MTVTILRDGKAAIIACPTFETILASAAMNSPAPVIRDAALDLWNAAGYGSAYNPAYNRSSRVGRAPIFQRTLKLHDEPSTREKATVMDKWDVMTDDERNPDFEGLDEFLEWGSTYRITIEKV